MNNLQKIHDQIAGHQSVIATLSSPAFVKQVSDVCNAIVSAITSGNKVLIFGNGGSASDAQHLAAEFTGRFVKERKGYAAIALTTDTSALTAISNDYGFNRIFARQVEALANPGDVLIGISTSGNSENVIQGLKAGANIGCKLIAFTGGSGGELKSICDLSLIVDSNITARIQEAHILIIHMVCSAIDDLH